MLNAKWTILQLYHDESKLILYQNGNVRFVHCSMGRHVASLWHIIMIHSQLTAPWVHMRLHSDTLVVYQQGQSHICGGAMMSNRKSLYRKWHQSYALSGSMFCACATGSCAISSLVVAFWPEVRKSRYRKRHCPEVACPEVALTGK
jgi:hypothetical protein